MSFVDGFGLTPNSWPHLAQDSSWRTFSAATYLAEPVQICAVGQEAPASAGATTRIGLTSAQLATGTMTSISIPNLLSDGALKKLMFGMHLV